MTGGAHKGRGVKHLYFLKQLLRFMKVVIVEQVRPLWLRQVALLINQETNRRMTFNQADDNRFWCTICLVQFLPIGYLPAINELLTLIPTR